MENNEGKTPFYTSSQVNIILGSNFEFETVKQWVANLPKLSPFANVFEDVEWDTFDRFTLQDLQGRGLPLHACVPLHKCLNVHEEKRTHSHQRENKVGKIEDHFRLYQEEVQRNEPESVVEDDVLCEISPSTRAFLENVSG